MRISQIFGPVLLAMTLVASACNDDVERCEGQDCSLSDPGTSEQPSDIYELCVETCEQMLYVCDSGAEVDFDTCISACEQFDEDTRGCFTNYCGQSLAQCLGADHGF